MTFEELNLKPELIQSVTELGFVAPMPVQEKVIPFLLDDTERDLVALAETGSGKTAAFGLPILSTVDTEQNRIQALILSPTRELCMQICKDLRSYGTHLRALKIVPVYGGENIVSQYRQLDVQPQVLVATPGRLVDLINRGKVHLENVRTFILDEADEMLDMGFKDDLETVMQQLPEEHRSLMFSATMPREIEEIANNYMRDHETITIGTRNAGAENVEHIYYMVKANDRYLALKRIVDINPDIYAIVFCRTRIEAKDIADNLIKDGYNADALHGDLSQAQRDTVMNRFRAKSLQVLVATDVAARGLDVSNLTHVINYNLPDDIEVYTHRSGRTGRAGNKGISIAIIHQREQYRIRKIERIIHKQFRREMVPTGDEICKRQLFHLIQRMEFADVSSDQISVFMPEITAKLSYLSKEDIIQRFVALEFNRFADYYKDAGDINITKQERKAEIKEEKRSKDRTDKKNRDKRGERKSEQRENEWNQTDRGFSKGERRQQNGRAERAEKNSFKEAKKRETPQRKGKKVRLKMHFGTRHNATPRSVLGIINNYTNDKSIFVGDIEITQHYTFFDVYADQADKVLAAFSGVRGRGMRVELA